MKELLIAIDGNEANLTQRVGVNTYAYEILTNLKKLQDNKEIDHDFLIYLSENPKKHLPKTNSKWKYKVLPGKGKWIITKLVPELYFGKEKPDLIFTPSHYAPPFSPIPRVCAIMDLGYLEFPAQFRKHDYWQLKYWSAWSINISKYILTISEATKKDIIYRYPKSKKKVFKALLAYDSKVFNTKIAKKSIQEVKNKYSIGNQYVLFLSTLKPSKNITGLLKAWKKIENKYPKTKLVITGKKGWLYEEIFENAQKLGLEDRVVFTGFVDEADKAPLIAGAKVFALPSFWEGFGLDVLNSLACGVPVVSSNAGSLPEVGGEAATHFNPYKTEEISNALEKVLKMNQKEYNKLSKKGITQANNFSWEKTARETIKVLEKAA